MAAITYGSLRNRVLDACNMVGSDFPDTSTTGNPLKMAINASIHALYDLLIDLGLTNLFLRSATITHTTAADKFVVATDVYKFLRLIWEDTDGTWYPLERFDLSELHDDHVSGVSLQANYDLRWAPWTEWDGTDGQADQYIKFSSNPPTATGTMRYYYVPIIQDIGASDADKFFIVDCPRSWEDWVVYDAAAYLLAREESDPGFCMAKKAEAEQRIVRSAKDREQATDYRMRDVARRWR